MIFAIAVQNKRKHRETAFISKVSDTGKSFA